MSIRVPDPGLTLSEAVNMEGVIRHFIYRSRAQGDAVLASGAQKLVAAAAEAAERNPEEFEKVKAEVEMQGRFGLSV